jgi:hypothetical protein
MMHLSLLSDGYVSDSYNDAGLLIGVHPAPTPSPIHFAALCRGLAVLFALALPVGMTLLAKPAPAVADQHDAARALSHGVLVRAANG